MMSLQLIFCVEANQQCKSDFMYIRQTLDRFYDYDNSHVQIRPVYMDGRGNYKTKKTLKKIKDLMKPFLSASSNNQSYVIYCFDSDEYDSKIEDFRFLEQARLFCNSVENYRFVWFCKDIEDVYLGKRIDNHQKAKEVVRFVRRKLINNINVQSLSSSRYYQHQSNLCLVLDEFLTRK